MNIKMLSAFIILISAMTVLFLQKRTSFSTNILNKNIPEEQPFHTPQNEEKKETTLPSKIEKVSFVKKTTTAEDLKKNMVLTFNEDFDTLNFYLKNGEITCNNDGVGTWQTVYHFCSRTIFANKEAQLYTDDRFLAFMNKKALVPSSAKSPFSINNGILTIQALPADETIKKAVGDWVKYTSGLLTTQFSFSQLYGYFEMRASVPEGKGLWPAFWLLPVDKSWPPEIDIMEAFGAPNNKNEGGGTFIHYASHLKDKSKFCGTWVDIKKPVYGTFNVYGAHWTKEGITYYFNGEPYATCPTNTDANQPFYILVNLAVGGYDSWPGEPDNNTEWPANYKIDYIRAYKSK